LESGESQYSFDKTNYSKDSLYGLAVHAFIDSVAEKIKGKAVAHICAAQLSLLMNDPYDATMHLQAAEKKKLTAAQVYYIKVAHLLCDVLREPVLSRHTETALLELFDKGKKNPYVIEPGIFTEQLKLFVANVLITKGDTARGIFLMARTSRCIGALPINFVANAYTRLAEIGTPAVYDQMLALFYKHNKSAFERYITIPRILNIPWLGSDHEITEQDLNDPVKWNPGMFLNLKAQWFINRDRLEEALAVYDGVPDSVWNDKIYRGYMTGNPVQPKILPYKVAVTTGCDTSIHSITRPDMLAALIQMKKQLRTQRGDEKARTCLRIAGAYFQMSYYGEYWIMNRIFWSANDSPEQQNDFNSMYFGCSLAGQWYREAEKWAATEPVASSAAFMARYCDKLYARYITTVQKNSYWVDLSYSSSTRNRELEKRFKRHPTYDDMISECH
jgi:hypothetical protein